MPDRRTYPSYKCYKCMQHTGGMCCDTCCPCLACCDCTEDYLRKWGNCLDYCAKWMCMSCDAKTDRAEEELKMEQARNVATCQGILLRSKAQAPKNDSEMARE